jgi:hypothetical protein
MHSRLFWSPLNLNAEKMRINLVLEQLHRFLEWTSRVSRSSTDPYIQDWESRPGAWELDTQPLLFEDPQHSASRANSIPSWLIQSQEKGKSHLCTRDVVLRLQRDVERGILEILPDFILEPNIIKPPKPFTYKLKTSDIFFDCG